MILKWYKPAAAATPKPAAAMSVPAPLTKSVRSTSTAAVVTPSSSTAQSANVAASSVSHDSVLDDDGEDLLATEEGNDEVGWP